MRNHFNLTLSLGLKGIRHLSKRFTS